MGRLGVDGLGEKPRRERLIDLRRNYVTVLSTVITSDTTRKLRLIIIKGKSVQVDLSESYNHNLICKRIITIRLSVIIVCYL